MDAWYPRLIERVLPQLVAQEGFVGQSRYDAPRAQGSAYQEGYFEHMSRVLQMVLGETTTPYRVLKCGDGTLTDCRKPPIHWINRPTFQQVVEVGGGE
jgi:hypothetical protein